MSIESFSYDSFYTTSTAIALIAIFQIGIMLFVFSGKDLVKLAALLTSALTIVVWIYFSAQYKDSYGEDFSAAYLRAGGGAASIESDEWDAVKASAHDALGAPQKVHRLSSTMTAVTNGSVTYFRNSKGEQSLSDFQTNLARLPSEEVRDLLAEAKLESQSELSLAGKITEPELTVGQLLLFLALGILLVVTAVTIATHYLNLARRLLAAGAIILSLITLVSYLSYNRGQYHDRLGEELVKEADVELPPDTVAAALKVGPSGYVAEGATILELASDGTVIYGYGASELKEALND